VFASGPTAAASLVFGSDDQDAEEILIPTRRFSVYDIASGLHDDSREADEQAAVRQLREVRARVKAARAAVATTPGLTETLMRDWRKAARFYARFGVTEVQFHHGVRVEGDLDKTVAGGASIARLRC
jgi:hypothetical protein